MDFLRVVEVFPPLLPNRPSQAVKLHENVAEFVSRIDQIRQLCDVVLVADVKDTASLKFSTVQAAALLQSKVGVTAAPVIVARDFNRPQALSMILTTFGLGLSNLMLAWGDRYPPFARSRNVYDFPNLASLISEARKIAERSGVSARLLAPVDLGTLRTSRGVRIARSRLEAGADFLLAQPPTTDAGQTLASHVTILESTGLKDRVLPGIFPFRDRRDVAEFAKKFGWTMPRSLYETANKGYSALEAETRQVAKAIRERDFPGVYLSTRGHPGVAKAVLGES